jgi:hypothetical protein
MEIIDLKDFLKIFNKSPQTYNEFINTTTVRLGSQLRPLKQYIKDKKIPTADIKLLFENIQNRDEYLTRFYNLSLMMREDKLILSNIMPMKNQHFDNNNESLCKNLIRNIHYKDILQNTKSGIENIPTFIEMLKDLYLKNIIDYKILTPSSLFYMKNGRLGSVFSSYYFRASILNPYLIYSLNESLLKGTKIFTPTLGWSSYCYGFLESPRVLEYIGTDVIPQVCKITKELAQIVAPEKTTTIYCKPSEDLFESPEFMKQNRAHFDVVFFSPPYYKLEMYEGGDQSTERYKTYEEWLAGYWEKTIQLCHHVLEPRGKLCYILSGYGSENTKEQYDLLGDMNKITKTYFKFHSQQPMYNKNVNVTKHRETGEQIMVFVKI